MASRITSSKDRNKGKAKKVVTTDKGRANRQSASSSKARITERGRQERGGARVTSAEGRPPKAPAPRSLPPGRPGGAIVPREGGGALARRPVASGNFKAPQIPQAVQRAGQAVGKAAGPAARMAGMAGRALGGAGMVGAAAGIVGNLMQTSPGQKAINARIQRDAAAKAEEKANPTRGGLTGDQRLANARADRARGQMKSRIAKSPVSEQRMAGGDQSPAPAAAPRPAETGGMRGRISSEGGAGRSAMPAAVTRAQAAGQSRNMEENYASWTRANKGLAEKVKPGQAGYNVIQKTLKEMKGGGSSQETTSMATAKPSEQGPNLSDMRKYGSDETPPAYESPAEKEKRKKKK
jgi:hypothetical protein